MLPRLQLTQSGHQHEGLLVAQKKILQTNGRPHSSVLFITYICPVTLKLITILFCRYCMMIFDPGGRAQQHNQH